MNLTLPSPKSGAESGAECNTPGVTVTRFSVGDATLVRVPYVDIVVDAEVVSLTRADVEAHADWANPTWTADGQVRVGAAVWIIESDGRRIVVDPTQAADDILRGDDAALHQAAVADALAAAGYPRESIDTVIASHIDGIGMIAWRDGDEWSPFFPDATFLISRQERDAIADDGPYAPSGGDAFLALDAQGAVTAVDDSHAVTPDVVLTWVGAHSPGHALINVRAGHAVGATLLGHLALSPLHCLVHDSRLHMDPVAAEAVLGTLADGRLLAGPLWPTPGAIRWTGTEITTATPD
jgi:hypothetical protein